MEPEVQLHSGECQLGRGHNNMGLEEQQADSELQRAAGGRQWREQSRSELEWGNCDPVVCNVWQ